MSLHWVVAGILQCLPSRSLQFFARPTHPVCHPASISVIMLSKPLLFRCDRYLSVARPIAEPDADVFKYELINLGGLAFRLLRILKG